MSNISVGIKRYGKTKEETYAESMKKCRNIVTTIMDFGVTQFEILKIIGLLSLELENRNQLKQISDLVKRLEEGDESKSTLITDI